MLSMISWVGYSKESPLKKCPKVKVVNCMPGPDKKLPKLCDKKIRTWVEQHCKKVEYLD